MKHLRIPLLAAIIGALIATPAFATQTRINSLSGGEKSITVRDQANIWSFPQFLPTYGNQVDVDATAGAKYGTMSVRYALTDDAVLLLYGVGSPWAGKGTVVNTQSIAQQTAGAAAGFTPTQDPTNHQFGIGFGTRIGEGMRLGTYLGIGGHNASGAQEKSNSAFDFNIGFGLDLSETNNLDFGLHIGIASFTDQGAQGDLYLANGLMNIALVAKGEFQVHQIAKLVPHITFAYDARGITHNADAAGNGAKQGNSDMTTITLGSDLAISPAEGVTVQPGIGLTYRQSNVSGNKVPVPAGPVTIINLDSGSSQIMPYYGFGAEAHAFDWLVLRVGARQTIIRTDIGNTAPNGAPSNEQHTSSVQNTVTTGFGINLRGWQIDLNVTPSFFNNGVFAVTGAPTAGFAADFAIVYDW
ncbi:MAG: hypothetical protein KC502_00610 [Myxococcales bacterium]|nr:hypothetical protein [Myxococcales bacterium]